MTAACLLAFAPAMSDSRVHTPRHWQGISTYSIRRRRNTHVANIHVHYFLQKQKSRLLHWKATPLASTPPKSIDGSAIFPSSPHSGFLSLILHRRDGILTVKDHSYDKIPGQEDMNHSVLFFSVFSVTLKGQVRIPSSFEVLSIINYEGICLHILMCRGPLINAFYSRCIFNVSVAIQIIGKMLFNIGY